MKQRLTLGLMVAVLAACATPPAPTPEATAPAPVESAPSAAKSPEFKNSTLKYLAKRNLKPQPTRPLNVRSRCSHKDAIGTVTRQIGRASCRERV